jgi:VanZ family protein
MIDKLIHFFIRNKVVIYTLFALTTLAILLLTLMPPDNLGSHRIFRYDKIGHFMMFFCWTLAYGLFSFTKKGPQNTRIIAIFFIGSLFGITIEVVQELMPYGRSGSVYDAIADILGSLSAAIVLRFIKNSVLINS